MSEPAGARLARLLTLVPWLMAHDGVTIEETAEHFGISPADLERDLWLLVVSGLPGHGPDQLVDIDFWDDGVIRVIDPQTLSRPLRLTPEESITLLIALRTLAQLPGVDDRAAILGAMAKIEAALTDEEQVIPQVEVVTEPHVADVIDEALRSGSGVHLTYASATRGEVTDRTIAPLQVRIVDGVGYLEAWCTVAEGVRSFRLDRILSAAPAPRPQLPTVDPRREAVEPIRALIAVTPGDRWVSDVIDSVGVEGTDDQGRTLLRVSLLSLEWGVSLVLSLGEGTRALEPPSLARAVAEHAAAAAAAYPHHVG